MVKRDSEYDVYIKTKEFNPWIEKYFPKQDLVTIDDLIGVIEQLQADIEYLEDKVYELENKPSWKEDRDYENFVEWRIQQRINEGNE